MYLARSLKLSVGVAAAACLLVAAAAPLHADGMQNLINDTRGEARISVDPQTGLARFVRLPAGAMASSTFAQPTAVAGDKAMNFFRAYGSAFGVSDLDAQLVAMKTIRDSHGNEHAIFQQTHEGAPVFGGELRAHFNGRGQLYAANGTFVSGIKVGMTPSLTEETAAGAAIRQVMVQQYKRTQVERRQGGEAEGLDEEDYEDLTAIATNLMVFRAGLIKGAPGRDHLAFEVEVVNPDRTVREFVYVDAHDGRVIDQITGIHDALDRRAFDAEGMTAPGPNYPGSPFWVEGDSLPTTDAEADNMILASGETYDLFWNAFGRDGFDGAGATMDAIFNRGNGCPNASWNGVLISFCPGLTTDDVTAHEWGHAYTQYTSNLIYQWQSGALNESYSDIWGETVDLINSRGTDSPGGLRTDGACAQHTTGNPADDNSLRWLMGEDVNAPGLVGAIRDMWSPNCYGDPGKVTDTAQYICTTFDNGGVHINSGIPNHAFALMVDGGTYNGYSGGGLGLTKAAHIHFGAQLMLTQASNFVDHADALDAACNSLETAGTDLPDLSTGLASGEIITAADCAEVSAISAAVEFRTPPSFCNFQTILDPDAPELCAGQGSVQNIYSENFESGSLSGWTASSHDVADPGLFVNPGWSVVGGLPAGASGSFAAFVPDINASCATAEESGALALDSPAIVLPAGQVPHVAFDHWVATENPYDGGNLKVSVNGGSWTLVPASAYSFNAYNDTLIGTNPLAGEDGFSGADDGSVGGSWGQSQVDLYGLAFPGDSVRLRFDFGTDFCFGTFGWYVDDVHVYTCSDEELPICGDGSKDPGEACDDGNMDDGDGCSTTCQVEDGWVCSDPTPGSSGANTVNDGSFEAGPFGGTWTEFSSTFGTPICDAGSCGTGSGTGPSDGDFWTWFGGIAAYEAGYVFQDVVIPATATDLTFDLEQIVCDSGSDYIALFVDSNLEWFSTGVSGLCGALGYSQQTVDISAYADGGTHELFFQSEIFADNGGGSNFFLDNVVLSDNGSTPGTPSVCIQYVDDVACNTGIVGFNDGIPGSWTVTDNTGLGLTWTNVTGSGENGNYTGGGGDAVSVSSDRFGPADFDTELISNPFSLVNQQSASVDYLVNYQNFAAFDFLDVDVTTDGGGTWSNLLSWNEDHGGFRGLPGEAVSLDLTPYVGAGNVQLRWRYYDPTTFDWDWYAQVDDVTLSCVPTPPRILKEEAVDLLTGIDDGDSDSDGISGAIEEIEKSLRPSYWIDDSHLDPKRGKRVFDAEKKAAKILKDLLDEDSDSDSDSDAVLLTPEQIATIGQVVDKLIFADDQLAQIALDEAIAAADAAGCEPSVDDSDSDSDSACNCDQALRDIAKAERALAKARAFGEAGICDRAISEYKRAWQHAQKAIQSVSGC